jgi:hypothetical protein
MFYAECLGVWDIVYAKTVKFEKLVMQNGSNTWTWTHGNNLHEHMVTIFMNTFQQSIWTHFCNKLNSAIMQHFLYI